VSGSTRRLPFVAGTILAAALGVLVTTGFRSAAAERRVGRIVFARASVNQTDIYVVNAHGSQPPRRLTHNGTAQSPDWAPSGKSILYVDAADGPGGAVYRMPATGGHAHRLFKERLAHQILQGPVWSPDGGRIAFATVRAGMFEVWTYSLSGKFEQITHEGSATQPTWSPDGRRLAYGGVSSGRATIFVARADGTKPRNVSHAPYADAFPVWSPTGKWIALRSLNRSWQKHEADSLVIVNAAGTVRKTLLTGGGIYPADWSPSGDAILFLWNRQPQNPLSDHRQLYTILVAGGRPRAVDGTQGASSASWHR
jgi:Tol biopolymer transport system component